MSALERIVVVGASLAGLRAVETLRGDTARRWYEIYSTSNWEALRLEAADTFHRDVTEADAEATRTARGQRCVLIHTRSVKPDELAVGRGST